MQKTYFKGFDAGCKRLLLIKRKGDIRRHARKCRQTKTKAKATRQTHPFKGVVVASRMMPDQSGLEKDVFATLDHTLRHIWGRL